MQQRKALLIIATLLLTAGAALSQQDRGTFTGTITDPSGAVVAGVVITVRSVDTNAVYRTRSNELGHYTAPNLPIGSYQVSAQAAGFKTFVREGLTLSVAQTVRVDISLEVGAASESVNVRADAPLLQTDSPDVGLVLQTQRVQDLPLSFASGRVAEDFAFVLTPGVQGNNWDSHINGSTMFSKEVLVDGASVSTYLQGSMSESSPSPEAVQEFKVQTSGMSAEFGRTAGGVFNFSLKAGANQVHGTGMFQIRNESWNANTFTDNSYGRPRAQDRHNVKAFSLGGPIYIPKLYNGKNKFFFYTAYERYKDRNTAGQVLSTTVPTAPWLDGDMSNYLTNTVVGKDGLGREVFQGQIFDPNTLRMVNGIAVRDPFAGNIIPKTRLSQVSQKVIDIMKKNYRPSVDTMINNFFYPSVAANRFEFQQDQFSVRSDYSISNNHRLTGSVVRVTRPDLIVSGGLYDTNSPDGGPFSKLRQRKNDSHLVRLAEDWTVTPTIFNHFGIAWNRFGGGYNSIHVNEPGGKILGISGIDQNSNLPSIVWSGGDRVNLTNLGYQDHGYNAGQSAEISDTLSWIKGRHSLRMGFSWRRTTYSDKTLIGPGEFTFTNALTGVPGQPKTGHPFASFLLGAVDKAIVTVNVPTTAQLVSYAAFIQDDMKVSRRLTVNLGLRWDGQPLQTEWHDRLHNFNPSLIDPWTKLPGAIEFAGNGAGRNGRRNFAANHWRDFAPRVGLAYQITDNLTFRGAYGVFFNARNILDWSGTPWSSKYGFTGVNQVVGDGVRPAFNWDNGYPGVTKWASLDASNKGSFWGPVHWDPNAGKNAYTQQWNVNLQYALPGQVVLDVGYLGNKSTGLQNNQLKQINQLHASALALGNTLNSWIHRAEEIPAPARALGAVFPYQNLPVSEYPADGWIPVSQTLQPFPQVAYWNPTFAWNSPLGFSTYNAFQLQINKRYSSGLTWLANYSFSKALGNTYSSFATWVNSGRPLDYYNLKLERSVEDFDQTHVAKAAVTYELPFGKGRRLANSLSNAWDLAVKGWTIVYVGNYSSGMPLGFSSTGVGIPGFQTNRPVITNPNGKPVVLRSTPPKFDMSSVSKTSADNRILNNTLFRDTKPFELGNAPYRMSQARGFGNYNEDLALQKNFRLKEEFRIQLRAEALNVFNRHQYSGINTNVASPLFGQVTGVNAAHRVMQLGIRADW